MCIFASANEDSLKALKITDLNKITHNFDSDNYNFDATTLMQIDGSVGKVSWDRMSECLASSDAILVSNCVMWDRHF